jgi:hypothetical protein
MPQDQKEQSAGSSPISVICLLSSPVDLAPDLPSALSDRVPLVVS